MHHHLSIHFNKTFMKFPPPHIFLLHNMMFTYIYIYAPLSWQKCPIVERRAFSSEVTFIDPNQETFLITITLYCNSRFVIHTERTAVCMCCNIITLLVIHTLLSITPTVLLNKKYTLPHRVIDQLVVSWNRILNTRLSSYTYCYHYTYYEVY